jgi:hypothetical protein
LTFLKQQQIGIYHECLPENDFFKRQYNNFLSGVVTRQHEISATTTKSWDTDCF